MFKYIILLILLFSCAIKHHVQVGEIKRVPNQKMTPFTVLISETGINLKEAGNLMSAVTKDNGRAKEIANFITMFQMGPRSGNAVFNELYADIATSLILEKCPSGNVTGLISTRETNKYPIVSGEIVKFTGFCNQ